MYIKELKTSRKKDNRFRLWTFSCHNITYLLNRLTQDKVNLVFLFTYFLIFFFPRRDGSQSFVFLLENQSWHFYRQNSQYCKRNNNNNNNNNKNNNNNSSIFVSVHIVLWKQSPCLQLTNLTWPKLDMNLNPVNGRQKCSPELRLPHTHITFFLIFFVRKAALMLHFITVVACWQYEISYLTF